MSGINLGDTLSDNDYHKIREAVCRWGVLVFRNQNITPDQNLKLGKRFDDLHVSKIISKVLGHPLVAEVRKEPDQMRNIGGNWHSDHSFAAVPPMGSILVARELPNKRGDTLFANMSSAYEKLSSGMKKTLAALSAIYVKKCPSAEKPFR